MTKILVDLDFDYSSFDLNKNIEFLDSTFFYIKSNNIENLGWKIYNSLNVYVRDYEMDSSRFNNIIPVLFINYPEIYKNGFVIFNDSYISIREVLSNIESNNIPSINMFIFTEVNNLKGQFFGQGEFSINIDTNSYFDIQGMYSKDISSIISRIFSANIPFKQTNIYVNDSSSNNIIKLYLLFDGYKRLSDGALIFRDKIQFKIRYCNLFSLQNYKYSNKNLTVDSIINNDNIEDLINKEVFVVNI